MDIGLPDQFDGFAVTQAIHQMNTYETTSIIVLTAQVEPEHKTRALGFFIPHSVYLCNYHVI